MFHSIFSIVLLLAIALTGNIAAAEVQLQRDIQSILNTSCVGCHGPKKQKSDFRVDTLNSDFVNGPDAEHWREVLEQLNVGEMPPEDEPQLTTQELARLTNWLEDELARAAAIRNRNGSGGGAVMRRLTRYEYNNTLQDLLGVNMDFTHAMPQDRAGANGLRNDGRLLGLSPIQLKQHIDVAQVAMRKALIGAEKPTVFKKRFEFEAKTGRVEAQGISNPTQKAKDGMVIRSGAAVTVNMPERPYEGAFRIRARVAGLPASGGLMPRLQVSVGYQATGRSYPRQLLGEVRVTARQGDEATLEFMGRMEDFPTPAQNPDNIGTGNKKARSNLWLWIGCGAIDESALADNDFAKLEKELSKQTKALSNAQKANRKKKNDKDADEQIAQLETKITSLQNQLDAIPSPVPRLFVDWVDFEGPFYTQWPPASRTNILKNDSQHANAKRIIRHFAQRAWRRPVKNHEIERYLNVYTRLNKTSPFEESIADTLAMVLASPKFMYLVEPNTDEAPRTLTPYELASRLSYFLWASMPDERLLKLASTGTILKPNVLASEVDRLLDDPKSSRFARHFTTQWLDVDAIDRVAVNPEYFPDFDDSTKTLMREETLSFFEFVLNENRSCLEFLDSDYAMLNETLAYYYGVPGVQGPEFRPVPVNSTRRRGGLITQAGFMLAHSTGAEPHAIFRGKWILERVLGDPPPPPPPNVPPLDQADPSFASLSLKDKLAFHREKPACARCHDKLDPWGIALEHFDATGRWRDHETTKTESTCARGKSKTSPNPIDARVVLFSGEKINDIAALKKHLVTEKADLFANGLTRKLLAYSLGRSLEWSDDALVDKLTHHLEQNDYRLRPLIQKIVTSKPFLQK